MTTTQNDLPNGSISNGAYDSASTSAIAPDNTAAESTSEQNRVRVTAERTRAASAPTSTAPRAELKTLPIGIVNESNTCFLNSTFQALSATAPLASLLTSSPNAILQPLNTTSLPAPIFSPSRIPFLQPETSEPPLYNLLPVTRAFTTALNRSWKLKDAGGGTMGVGETAQGRSMSLRSLLRELARKYDQYDDYQQQDAHELLRHLLDSMEMEEKDVVKKLQPVQPVVKKRKSKSRPINNNHNHAGISPLASPLPSPAHSIPSSPIKQTFAVPAPLPVTTNISTETDPVESLVSPTVGHDQLVKETFPVIPHDQKLIPFVDVLFGGSLASVVVCAKCKSVSHTYEGFLDISLSLKEDEPKPRKRDRLRAMAQRFVPRGSSKNSPDTPTSPSNSPSGQLSRAVSVSDGELSDSDMRTERSARRRSLDQDDRNSESGSISGLSRNNSKSFGGLRNKTSFSFRRKGQRSSSNNSTPPSPDVDKTPAALPISPKILAQAQAPAPAQAQHHQHHEHLHNAAPTPAQAAYIARILTPPQGTTDPTDPLARLRQANNGEAVVHAAPVEYGLLDSLRAFTSVEVLEGENAFACRKCWKIKHGRYSQHEAPLKEEDEDDATSISASNFSSSYTSELSVPSPRVAPPSISILDSTSTLTSPDPQNPLHSSPAPMSDDDRHLRSGRGTSIASSSSRTSLARAPSPLRRQVEDESYVEQMSHATLESYPTISTTSTSDADATNLSTGAESDSSSSDGLSDSDSSEDEAKTPGPNDGMMAEDEKQKTKKKKGKEKNKDPRKNSHFVMGRAFKRYLIAEAPEIMVFHFKRFKQLYKTSMSFSSFYNLKKIDDFMPFPEMLDLAPFLAPNRKDYKVSQTPNGPHAGYMDWAHPEQGPELEPVNYRLYAVVVHLGTMIGGHYIAYCLVDPEKVFGTPKPSQGQVEANVSGTNAQGEVHSLGDAEAAREPESGKKDRRVWCYCSDTSIRLATVSEVLAARAYLCFYEKVHA